MLNDADAADHLILSEVISKEPLGPMIRSGDQQWFDIVRWVVLVMILAEEKGLSSTDVASLHETGDPEVSRLLGQANGLGEAFGLDKDWAARVIAQVGNYGEVFDRNLGRNSPLGIERGLNALWSSGGLHFAPPLGW
jgi:general L-amino acid transport system substrate-binding protein